MAKMRQTDKLDEDQFSVEEEEEYGDDIVDDSEEEADAGRYEAMDKASSSFNLSKGATIGVVAVLVIAIVAIFVFKPFGGDGEGFNFGKFFGQDNSLGDSVLGGDNSTKSYEDSLIEYLEGYTVTDNGDDTYTVTGERDGKPHVMTYDNNFNVLSEKIGDEVISYQVDPETGERVPSTAMTAGNTSVPTSNAEIVEGDNMVKVDRWSYEHSQLGMSLTELNLEYDENEILISNSYEEKFIVEYTRLPLRGHTPQVFVKIMETDIELIFNVSIDNYLKLSDSGASLINAVVTEVGGKKLFSNIKFDEWK